MEEELLNHPIAPVFLAGLGLVSCVMAWRAWRSTPQDNEPKSVYSAVHSTASGAQNRWFRIIIWIFFGVVSVALIWLTRFS